MDIDDKKLMKGADIQALRELLEAGVVDIYWIAGIGTTNSTWKLTGEASERPIQDPSLSILTRFLSKHPELNFMPKFPNFYETFEKITETSPELFRDKRSKDKLSVRRFAPLFGKNSWSSSQWEAGESPSSVVSRLFYLVLRAIEEEGEDGLKKYLDVVEEEALARGFKGMDDLLDSGTWKTKPFREKINEDYGEAGAKKETKSDND